MVSALPIILLSFRIGLYPGGYLTRLQYKKIKHMESQNLNNAITVLGFIAFALPFIMGLKNPTWIKLAAKSSLIIVGLLVMILSIIKNNKDTIKDTATKNEKDSLNSKILIIQDGNKLISSKLDTANVYIKRLDSMGVKRDSIRNIPIITKYFINNIGHIEYMEQHN